MSKKIAIISCSNANLEYFEHHYDIKIFRSMLHLGDEDYLDYTDIKAEDFYKRLEEDKSIFPSTSFMPIGQMIEIYEDLVKEGYTDAIVISISKEMSGIFNAALMAANEVEELDVKVFDSKSIAFPQAKMVLTAAKMVEEGKSVARVVADLNQLRYEDSVALFTVAVTRLSISFLRCSLYSFADS